MQLGWDEKTGTHGQGPYARFARPGRSPVSHVRPTLDKKQATEEYERIYSEGYTGAKPRMRASLATIEDRSRQYSTFPRS